VGSEGVCKQVGDSFEPQHEDGEGISGRAKALGEDAPDFGTVFGLPGCGIKVKQQAIKTHHALPFA